MPRYRLAITLFPFANKSTIPVRPPQKAPIQQKTTSIGIADKEELAIDDMRSKILIYQCRLKQPVKCLICCLIDTFAINNSQGTCEYIYLTFLYLKLLQLLFNDSGFKTFAGINQILLTNPQSPEIVTSFH